MTVTRPVAGRRAIEVLLQTELKKAPGRRLVLVDAVWDPAEKDSEFTVTVGGERRRVVVSDQHSPLGVADAWHRHLAGGAVEDDRVLVVTGTVAPDQLGLDLRAHAVSKHPLPVDRAEIVVQLFGATDLDPRMLGEHWLLDALLQAEPLDGWPRVGAVLTRDRAVRALLGARLGLGDPASDTLDLDADTLFAWTRTPAGPSLYEALPKDERDGLAKWLTRAVGPAAPTLLALAAEGRGSDALPLGVLASAALGSQTAEAAGFALGTLFGPALASFDTLRPFADAATGVLTRWIAQAEGTAPPSGPVRSRVLAVLERADRLAADARLTDLVRGDQLLPSGYRGRLRTLAACLGSRGDGAVAVAESALRDLGAHQLAALHAESTETARTAVRLMRWLAVEPAPFATVGQAVQEHLSSSGWADLAIGVLAEGDVWRDAAVGEAYRQLIGAARERRAALDARFADLLASWSESARQQSNGGALLIEDVLAKAAAPLAQGGGRPLILVLDGMSADVAVRIAGELDGRAWTEIVPVAEKGARPRRQAAVSMLPSVTRVSRASLLCGRPSEGGQAAERTGFTAFWRKRHRGAHLFHKGGYEGPPGHRLAPELVQTLASDDVVAVVVNTIDDALADGREGTSGRWGLADIGKLPDLLNAARDYGRPVVLVSDHGHVIDRTERGHLPAEVTGVRGARWRTGDDPCDGEVVLTGPRVQTDGKRIIAAWRDDLRYTARQAGYHGGAALAEVTVPVITLVPSEGGVPSGWALLPPESAEPTWWKASDTTEADAAPGQTLEQADQGPVAPQQRPTASSGPLTLGQRTVRSAPYRTQREFVRLAPTDKAVEAALDALDAAGGKLSPGAVAAAAQAATGKSQRNPARFATMLERLLNIDGYPVLQLVESGRTVQLDRALLTQQFPSAEGTA
ncbi:BREX-2 system phosphatase PglZ [Streptomyces griseorubiginosus]|uniref:BREX-2 system phosphatase PglZ n=1 Tax=Streptomyces griseorubiginosus TaxID=67304 RepID=UPI001AD7476F|nr:BREX-2 system phosphatase PglZ [Streptomyces griseorubiginosus]MBO4254796.1 BREX-2 system phosphatase PglZ [Streptomyces griseorubiginosus]